MNSLRRKLTAGYSAIAALLVGLSLFSVLELRLVEQKIGDGEKVAAFFDVALEVRRFEKNYFLYRQAADLVEHRAYLDRGRALLAAHAGLFEAIGSPAGIAALTAQLERYGALMDDYARRGAGHDGELVAAEIRHTGKALVTVAEELARAERRALQAMLDRQRWLLVASVVAVVLLAVAIGQLLARRVGRPLKEMETKMSAIAAGRLATLEMDSDDREIVSLTRAFNRVLHDLELRQGQLVRSEKLAALGTLLSGVAHELNNPLSNIATSTQILAEEIGSNETEFLRELAAQIDGETWRARRIVRSLLDYARDRDFRREALPLARVVEDSLRLIRGRIPAQVTLKVDIPDNLEVAGDRQRLQQVLFNLVGNAIEATAGAGDIVVAARRADTGPPAGALVVGQPAGDTESVEIAVTDNGHGIAADVLPRVFDPFFTTKEVGQGLGLGLFIVFEIVEEHGGCIAVASAPGQGTTFRVRLPSTNGDKCG